MSGDDEDSDDEGERPTVSPEEKKTRMELLVAPLPADEWGASSASLSAATASTTPATVPLQSSAPKLTEEKYDGHSDSSSESEVDFDIDEEGDEPAFVDEGLDMGEEVDEFLKFATETLGLSEEQYEGILKERRGRGGAWPTSLSSRYNLLTT